MDQTPVPNEKERYTHEVVTASIHHENAPFKRPNARSVAETDLESNIDGPDRRGFGLLSLIGLAYAILNSWTAMATSMSVALPSGGPCAIIWGIIPSFIGNFAMAASMAEICSVYPTSGGQYHWAAILSPAKYAPLISYFAGFAATSGWIFLHATAGSLAGQLITGAIALNMGDSYTLERWHIFLIYVGYTLIGAAINIFGLPILPRLNQAAIFWSLTGLIVIIIAVLACSSPNYSSGKFVFTSFINETGWPDGVAWILALLQSCFGLTGYDAASHLVEEMPKPHRNAPIVMMASVVIGAVTSFFFLIVLLFVIKNMDLVISSPTGPILQVIYQATSNKAGAICLLIFPIICMFFTTTALCTAASRMILAFARDDGLPFSRFFSRMNHNGVPVPAVLASTVIVIIFGLVYLGSSAALNAILSTSVVALNVSYCVPISLVLIRGRGILSPDSLPAGTFKLGPILGPICNIVGLIFTIVTTVFFLFPPEIPATGSSMNYAVAVFAIVAIIATVTWFVQGRKKFVGPRDLGALLELARTEVSAKQKGKKHTVIERENL